jgi:DNA-directed RNA polymerase specialized sigma24 family protein
MFAMYYWGRYSERAREDERRRLREAVHDLPDWQPTIVIMHAEDRYNYLEIAAKLEMPAQFVLNELAKAYSTLRLRTLEREPAKARWNLRARLVYRLLGG